MQAKHTLTTVKPSPLAPNLSFQSSNLSSTMAGRGAMYTHRGTTSFAVARFNMRSSANSTAMVLPGSNKSNTLTR